MVDRKLTEKEEEMIVTFGALGYDIEKMNNIIGFDLSDLLKDQTTQVYKLHKKGADLSDYMIDKKLLEMAQAGDLKALQQYEYRKKILKK